MRRDRSEDVPAVEGVADRLGPQRWIVGHEGLARVRDGTADGLERPPRSGRAGPVVETVEHVAEQPVVRAYERTVRRDDDQGPPVRPDTRIDDRDMDRVRRKRAGRELQDEGTVRDVMGRDLMGDVDNRGARTPGQQHTLHRRRVAVPRSEIGGQRYEGDEGAPSTDRGPLFSS